MLTLALLDRLEKHSHSLEKTVGPLALLYRLDWHRTTFCLGWLFLDWLVGPFPFGTILSGWKGFLPPDEINRGHPTLRMESEDLLLLPPILLVRFTSPLVIIQMETLIVEDLLRFAYLHMGNLLCSVILMIIFALHHMRELVLNIKPLLQNLIFMVLLVMAWHVVARLCPMWLFLPLILTILSLTFTVIGGSLLGIPPFTFIIL